MDSLILFLVVLFSTWLLSITNVAEALASPSTTTAHTLDQRRIQVRVERHLAHITAQDAKKAWLDFVWNKGGGLPLIGVIPRTPRQAGSADATVAERRMLLPIGMEEELDDNIDGPASIRNNKVSLQYRVVNSGLLFSEIVPGSHLGTVSFESSAAGDDEGAAMVWEVAFDATTSSRAFLWQAVTERTIAMTCENFKVYVAEPKLFRRTTFLKTSDAEKSQLTAQQASEKWVDFCWKEGGGLPLPIPPIQIGDGARLIVPPFLKERIMSQETIDVGNGESFKGCQIVYQVENPSLFTYQVFSHQGKVQFLPEIVMENGESCIRMVWEVEIKPYPSWESIVQQFTAAVVSCYSRNFKCRIQEGRSALVPLKPPRGGPSGSDNTFLKIRKDSWLGGVLDAHLKDKRTTIEQTIAIFQPWTWGRTSTFDEEGEGQEWVV